MCISILGLGSLLTSWLSRYYRNRPMAVSMKNLDVAFQGVGVRPGMEVWRIENFCPVPVPKSEHGKFYSGDSYVVLRTKALKSGAFHYDLHFWLGKDTSQDEAGAVAIKTVELDAALGGRAVRYRECQGHETDLFLSYFKPCIIPLEGGVKSGSKEVEAEHFETRLFVCRGARLARVTQVPFLRQSLNHDDVFILDTKDQIFQFNGANSSIQERGKALEVVQHLKDTNHDGKCGLVIVDDGKLGAESDAGEFWGLFGGFAPLGKRPAAESDSLPPTDAVKLFCVVEGQLKEIEGISALKRDLLNTHNNYLIDAGSDVYIWIGRDTSLDQRKAATLSAEEFMTSQKRPSSTHVICIIEGFETHQFKSLFDKWPATQSSLTEDGRGKVAALLKQQGVNVKGLLKGAPAAEHVPPVLLDNSGKLEVWRVDGNSKIVVAPEDHGKFFDAHCYIVLYTYHGERKDEYLLCNWLGKMCSMEEKAEAFRLTTVIADNLKGRAVQAFVYQDFEPVQFLALFPCVVILKGSYEFEFSQDSSYLLRVEGTAGYNCKTVLVEPTAASLNSSESFILLAGKLSYTWYGSFTSNEQHKLPVKVTSFLKLPSKPVKEGSEPSAFWNVLGGKQTGYPAHRDSKDSSNDPRLFYCTHTKGRLEDLTTIRENHGILRRLLTYAKCGSAPEVKEVFNFGQDDLLTEDVLILDIHSAIYVWVGRHASSKEKQHAFDFAQEYLDTVLIKDGVSPNIPLFRIPEGLEPVFFTTYFNWSTVKAPVYADSYTKRLAALQGHKAQVLENHDNNTATQRKVAMAALNSVFSPQNSNPTSPKTTSPKSTPFNINSASSQRAAALAALSSVLGQPGDPKSSSAFDGGWVAVSSPSKRVDLLQPSEGDMGSGVKLPISSSKGGHDEPSFTNLTYRYDRLKVSSTEPIPGIDPKRREAYLSKEDFEQILGMERVEFYKLPKWKQDQRKRDVGLF